MSVISHSRKRHGALRSESVRRHTPPSSWRSSRRPTREEHMPNSSRTKVTKSTGQDAIQMLMADHKEVKAMFMEFEALKERTDADDEKPDLVERICAALTIHATVEEEIFYPAVREAIDDEDLMDEADVEHASAKDLIAQLEC